MSDLKKCVCCGKEFVPFRLFQKYCSKECRDAITALNKKLNRRPKTKVKRKCECCGKEFETYCYKQKYCSSLCYGKAWQFTHPYRLYKCIRCGKEFLSRTAKKKYCSEECKKTAVVIKCKICDEEFTTTDRRRKYCSEECRKLGNNIQANEYNKKHKPKKKKYICAQCHKPFLAWRFRKFCSAECQQESQKRPASKYASGTFEENVRRADECGLSYGKYMAALRLGKTFEELKIKNSELKIMND